MWNMFLLMLLKLNSAKLSTCCVYFWNTTRHSLADSCFRIDFRKSFIRFCCPYINAGGIIRRNVLLITCNIESIGNVWVTCLCGGCDSDELPGHTIALPTPFLSYKEYRVSWWQQRLCAKTASSWWRARMTVMSQDYANGVVPDVTSSLRSSSITV